MNKYISSSFKRWVLEVELEYLEELYKLHNDFPLASDKKCCVDYNIRIGTVKKNCA